MKANKFLLFFFIFIILIATAEAWTPPSDAEFRDFYALYNATEITAVNVTADNFIGNLIGSFTIGADLNFNEYSLINASNVNATTFYQNNNIVCDDSNNCAYILASNEALLNVNSSDYWDNLDSPTDIQISDLDQTGESSLNVNSSNYWDSLNTPADINAGDINDDGTYILSSSEGNLNVNSSDYWDGLNSPADFSWSGDLSGSGLSPSVVDNSHIHGSTSITDVNGSLIQNMNLQCGADTYFTALNFTDESATCTAISDVYLLNSGDTATGDYNFDSNTLFVDSADSRIGIGTTSPNSKLDIQSNSDIVFGADQDAGGDATSYIRFGRYNNANYDNYFYRNLDSTKTAVEVLTIVNDNAADDQDTLNVRQDGLGDVLVLDHNNNGRSILIDSEATTVDTIQVLADVVTAGEVAVFRSGVSHTGSNIIIDQNGNGIGLNIDTEATSSNGINVDVAKMTTGNGISVLNAPLFTSGNALKLDINSAGMTGNVIFARQDSVSATGHLVNLDNDGTGSGVFINQDGNGVGLNIDSEATTVPGIFMDVTPNNDVTSQTIRHSGDIKHAVWRNDDTNDNVVLQLGSQYLWVDSSGRLRISGSYPSSDTSGVVVGTQT